MTTRQIKVIPPLEVTSKTPITVVTEGLNSPQVLNFVTDPTPNTETGLLLSGKTRVTLINRGSVAIKFSFLAGTSGTIYASLYPNAPYTEDGLSGAAITVYFQAPAASQRIEAITWS